AEARPPVEAALAAGAAPTAGAVGRELEAPEPAAQQSAVAEQGQGLLPGAATVPGGPVVAGHGSHPNPASREVVPPGPTQLGLVTQAQRHDRVSGPFAAAQAPPPGYPTTHL